MIAGRIAIDGFTYKVERRTVPRVHPATQQPIPGTKIDVVVLSFTDGHNMHQGLDVHFTEDDFETFKRSLDEKPAIAIVGSLPPGLANGNGH